MKFNLKYFLLTIILFCTEILIATVFKDWVFVRSYLGDVIVVILVYTFILSFVPIQNKTALILGVFAFSIIIELLQLYKTADLLGFKEGSIPHIMLGNSFSWIDIWCYASGCLLTWIVAKFF